jgi:mRNA-degrading endonuclease toxin of MazEF toxin-antitoxin module
VGVELHQLCEGQIVWAVLRDRRGFRKTRPAIILTPDEEIAEDQPLALMAVTTTFPAPAPPNHVEIPWHPDRRRTSTGLARRSAAVVDWFDTAYPDEVDLIIGRVSPRLLGELRRRLADRNP